MESILLFLVIALLVPEKYKEILFKFVWDCMKKVREVCFELYERIKSLGKKEETPLSETENKGEE